MGHHKSGAAARSRTRGFGRGLLASVVLAGATLTASPADAVITTTEPSWDPWITNGRVWSIVEDGDDLYLGGSFTAFGPNTGHAVHVDAATGAHLAPSPRVNGTVFDATSDGAGGWFVVGSFDRVNGVARGRGAHLLAGGGLGAWNPDANATIRAVERIGSTLAIGGDFTTVDGVARSRLALTGPSGGPVGGWVANANATVSTLALNSDRTRLLVGGTFTNLDGNARARAGAVSVATGDVDGWNPNPNGAVNALALSPDGARVYLGGAFTSVGLVPRQRLAAVDAFGGTADLGFAANVDGAVNAISVLPDGNVHIGGSFTKLKGVGRRNAGAVTPGGAVLPWNPTPDGPVNVIAPAEDGTTAWLGGNFGSVRFTSRLRLARVDLASGLLASAANPRAMAQIRAIGVSGSTRLLIGGDFASVGIVNRSYLARLDRSTGALDTGFTPSLNGQVETMDLSGDGSTLYLGGRFTTINGAARRRAGAITVPNGATTGFNPNVDGIAVQAIDQRGSAVVIGGQFTKVSGLPFRNLARLNPGTGAPDISWTPNPNAQVRDVDITSDGDVIAAGDFTRIGPLLATRTYLARIDSSGSITPWAPKPSHFVYEGVLNGSETRYYVAILGPGGEGGNAVDAISTAGEGARLWHRGANGDVQALALSPDEQTVYAGGHFSRVHVDQSGAVTADRNRLMALRSSDGVLLSWRPLLDSAGVGVFAITATPNGLYVGGDFTRIGPVSSRFFAVFPGSP